MAAAQVKICGLSTPATMDAACEAGAAFVGLVLYPPSPRAVTPAEAAALAARVPPGVAKVALTVAPDDDALAALVALPLDMVQVHGVDDAARLGAIRERLGLPLIAARGVAAPEDVDAALALAGVADMLLLDAKPADAPLPGGNGVAFDWRLLAGRRIGVPWMLAGGLTSANVAMARALTNARFVDVSSGVERAPGEKDPARIRAFVAAARG